VSPRRRRPHVSGEPYLLRSRSRGTLSDLARFQVHNSQTQSPRRRAGPAPDGGLDVAAVDVPAFATDQVAGVSRVAAAGGPPLVAFFAVVLDPGAHPFDECRQGVPVPLFERVAGQRVAGSAALVGQDGDLVDEVGVLGPSSRG